MAQAQQLTPAQQAAMQQQAIALSNQRCRAALLAQAYPIEQPLPSMSVDLTRQNKFELIPNNTGLVTGFLLKVDAIIKNSHATEAMTITPFGLANLLEKVEYYDPNNNQRINTTGWHLNMINSIKEGKPFMMANPVTPNGNGLYGDNFSVIVEPVTIAAATSAPVRFYYYIPLAVSATSDLRGAVLANIPNAQQRLNLQFTRPENAFLAAAGNPLAAIFRGGTGSFDKFEFTVYQHYYDQLPRVQSQDEANFYGVGVGGYIAPMQDLATYYKLEQTVVSGLSENAEKVVQYGSAYKYMSTSIVYDNGGQMNAGDDISYITQQSANQVNLNKLDPITWAAKSRRLLAGSDLPKGVYFVPNYDRPIYTLTYGNMSLVVNPKTVNANARLFIGFEYTVESQVLVNAGTIATS